MATTARQKFLLVGLGLFLTLLLLEIGLRLGGFIFLLRQSQANQLSVATSPQNEFRILCIGESTTALGGDSSYPALLEKVLNSRNLGYRFKVINAGRVSKRTDDILAELPNDLDRYQPHLVISMIGVNDDKIGDLPDVNSGWWHFLNFLEHFRSYKFFNLLSQHISHKISEIRQKTPAALRPDSPSEIQLDYLPPPDSPDLDTALRNWQATQRVIESLERSRIDTQALSPKYKTLQQQIEQLQRRNYYVGIYLGDYFCQEKAFSQGQSYLETAITQRAQDFPGYLTLGRCYKYQAKYPQAVAMLQKALILFPNSELAHLDLGEVYTETGRADEARKIYQYLLKKDLVNKTLYGEIGRWFKKQNLFSEAEKSFQLAIQNFPQEYSSYSELSELYRQQGKMDLAKTYAEEARSVEERNSRYTPFTVRHYQAIAETILSRGITLVCMQYPLRDITPLQESFAAEKRVIFVENKNNFLKAIRERPYSYYFSDSFAGDFGHCTRFGNRLIAENVAGIIVQKILKEPKLP